MQSDERTVKTSRAPSVKARLTLQRFSRKLQLLSSITWTERIHKSAHR
jgi:hypothetical protein